MAKTWTKELEIDNNTYRLTFWKDNWGFPWTRIEKKVWVRPWYSKKYRAEWEQIREYWSTDDPIETALEELAIYLTRIKEEKKFEKALDNWCKQWYN